MLEEAKFEALLREPRINRVICLSDLDYKWYKSDLRELNRLRKDGYKVYQIVDWFDRDPYEIFLALMHLARLPDRKTNLKPVEIMLEELDFLWDEPELRELKYMWKKGFSIPYAAEYFGRDPDEIVLAIMHLAREKKITQRRGGLIG